MSECLIVSFKSTELNVSYMQLHSTTQPNMWAQCLTSMNKLDRAHNTELC